MTDQPAGTLILVGVIWLVFAVVAGFLLSAGISALRRSRRLRRTGLDASGTVVGNEATRQRGQSASGADRSRRRFRPVVRYTTRMGAEVTATGPVSSGSAYETGTAVELRYDPDHPLDVELQSGRGRGSAAMTRLFAGIAILLAASALAVIAVSGSAPRGCPAHRTAIHRITC